MSKKSATEKSTAQAGKNRTVIKMVCAVGLIVLAAVLLLIGGKIAFDRYRSGAVFGVDSVSDQVLEITAHRARKGEAGGNLTVQEGQKIEINSALEGKGAVHVFVYPNMIADAEQPAKEESKEAEEASAEPTEDADAKSVTEAPEKTENAGEEGSTEFRLITDKSFVGSETASFELDPGEYFLWFRVEKKATGTMTVEAK